MKKILLTIFSLIVCFYGANKAYGFVRYEEKNPKRVTELNMSGYVNYAPFGWLEEYAKDGRNGYFNVFTPLLDVFIADANVDLKARSYAKDIDDLVQEGMIGLSKAIKDYSEQKDVQFITFANVCIERQMFSFMRNISTGRHKVLNESLSFDTTTNTYGKPLINLLDDKNVNPETTFIESEEEEDLHNDIVSVLNEKEIYYIKFFNSYIGQDKNKNYGYNMTPGGEGKNYDSYDKIFELWDAGNSISQIAFKIKYNRDTIRRILIDYENYSIEESNRRAHVLSGLSKSKSIIQYDLEGNFIKEFDSVSQAERETKISHSNIINVANHKKGHKSAGGYRWEYK